MILRPTSAATTIASRRCSPRECARSQGVRRRRQSGSGPPWPLSKPRFSLAGGSARDATNGTCRSVTYVTVATGRGPRQECSRAASRIPGGMSKTATSRTPTTRRQSICARSRRTTQRRRSCRSSAPPGRRGAPAQRSGATRLDGPKGGGSKGKFPKGRGTRSGAAAWLGVGVVASTCRGTGLVRGPVPLRLPPRPVGRAAPVRFAASRRNHSGRVAEPVLAATSYTWALARRVLNRLAHICTGNISAWAGVAAALAAPVLLSIQRGSVGDSRRRRSAVR